MIGSILVLCLYVSCEGLRRVQPIQAVVSNPSSSKDSKGPFVPEGANKMHLKPLHVFAEADAGHNGSSYLQSRTQSRKQNYSDMSSRKMDDSVNFAECGTSWWAWNWKWNTSLDYQICSIDKWENGEWNGSYERFKIKNNIESESISFKVLKKNDNVCCCAKIGLNPGPNQYAGDYNQYGVQYGKTMTIQSSTQGTFAGTKVLVMNHKSYGDGFGTPIFEFVTQPGKQYNIGNGCKPSAGSKR